ncbi:MAG: 50S ribosomal protein L10 [Schleiferiaceae bacterium]|jgi:large subunit ribosomal protein L10|nr:50S ribosomal protein L10 [Schleiferiaceae bacterium]
MTKEQKNREIEEITSLLESTNTVYIADIAGLNAADTSSLRRLCHQRDVSLSVVKNTLLRKAMERSEKDFEELYDVLKGNTSVMVAEAGNAPAKLIKEFRKKSEKPILKGAYIDESVYVGDDQVDMLSSIKSKEELIGDVITLLQSPAKNVISALQSGGSTIAGLVKTLEERG